MVFYMPAGGDRTVEADIRNRLFGGQLANDGTWRINRQQAGAGKGLAMVPPKRAIFSLQQNLWRTTFQLAKSGATLTLPGWAAFRNPLRVCAYPRPETANSER